MSKWDIHSTNNGIFFEASSHNNDNESIVRNINIFVFLESLHNTLFTELYFN